jgi:hypothetical protein
MLSFLLLALPSPVTELPQRAERCVHFAGEEPYDADRKKEGCDTQGGQPSTLRELVSQPVPW